ncbi:MAG: SDR family oxidoreductase [Dehalococcoidia bacterium]|nr:SDR family oxidoreductase [Dehalococcoidia bacterium]
MDNRHIDPTRHEGNVAIVTGAGSGIGRATALRLVLEGATVIACDVNEEGLREVTAEAGQGLEPVAGDLTQQAAVDAAVAQANKHGHVDIVANIAGIMDSFVPVHELDDALWRRVLSVNLDAPMMLTRAVVPGMMERGRGAIVNIASVGGLKGGISGVAYGVSKHGVIGLTRSTAWTYRNAGIRCNAVCPGGVETNIGTTAAPRSPWAFEQYQPALATAGRMAEPDEIAALVSWLASDEASNVNGAIITADNGWTAG